MEEEKLLYHYCSLESFKGIVESKCLHLVNIFYMTDSKEHVWLRDILRERIRSLEEEPESFIHFVLPTAARKMNPEPVYCACFSEHRDSLSQWRAFANNCKGVVIGFRRSIAAETYDGRLRIGKMIYDSREHERYVEKCVALYNAEELRRERASAYNGRIHDFWRDAAICKNPAFASENEHRLIYVPRDDRKSDPITYDNSLGPCEFKNMRDFLIPYYKLRLLPEANPIASIGFGPKCRRENETSVLACLNQNGFSGVLTWRAAASERE